MVTNKSKYHSFREALTFDDVLLVPAQSNIMPAEVDTHTQLTKNIKLGLPLLSAAMDTVTESELAITLAQAGGMGVLHRNMSPQDQADQVRKVKRFESGMVVDPVTIRPNMKLAEALSLMAGHNISSLPVTESSGKLVGILTHRDVRFADNLKQQVSTLMTKESLVTVRENVKTGEAKKLLHHHRIEKLLVVNKDYHCVGLITVKDIENANAHPHATKDKQARLRVAAASTVGEVGFLRSSALLEAGADLIVIDTAHGHSSSVPEAVKRLKKAFPKSEIMAGNVATGEAAKTLIGAGADAIKIGIGPGSICTTRIIAGVGVPQLTAILDVVEVVKAAKIPAIADGGVRFSGDFAKAIAAGANAIMVGALLAGTSESPGEVFLYQGRSYKSYRGMGSVGAMAQGSADRYFQQDIDDSLKLVPEGIEGQIPYKGSAAVVIHQLIGGLRAAMGYLGAENIPA
ncbi:MAG: IMP dehydrogenase, partial [Parvibaculales bacterium]